MLFSSFVKPGVVMVRFCILGCGLGPLFGIWSSVSVVNTEWNLLFKMLALSVVRLPSVFSAAIPDLSVRIYFIYWNSFFDFAWLKDGWSGSFIGYSQYNFFNIFPIHFSLFFLHFSFHVFVFACIFIVSPFFIYIFLSMLFVNIFDGMVFDYLAYQFSYVTVRVILCT